MNSNSGLNSCHISIKEFALESSGPGTPQQSEFCSCARVFGWRGSPAVGISLLRSNLQVEGLPSSWNSLLRVPLSESSTSLRVPPPESSTSLRVPPPGSSTPLGVPLPWEFHSSGNSTALGVPLLWSFTLLGVRPPGNSLGNPPVKVSQNSDPLTELSLLHAFNAWVHTSIYIYGGSCHLRSQMDWLAWLAVCHLRSQMDWLTSHARRLEGSEDH